MIILQQLSYRHSNKELLFSNISLSLNNHDKLALIGNNGVGKSTLLKIIAGQTSSFEGQIQVDSKPYYVPQIFGQYNHLTIAQALGVENKLHALREILEGVVTQENLDLLQEDWGIEERCKEALSHWQLDDLDLVRKLGSLSGGQKTKVFLAGVYIHEPLCVLLDEPSNHLDGNGRQLLYDFIQSTNSSLLVVSHDRKLLNLLDSVCEMDSQGMKVYGGNYDFYLEQKQLESSALSQDIQNREKTLRRAKEKERDALERQQKLDSRGKGKQKKAGVARIMMKTLRNKAENSSSKLKSVHAEKIGDISEDLQRLRKSLPDRSEMKFGFDKPDLHPGKILFKAAGMNFSYRSKPLWNDDLNFRIISGDRIALKGRNGSGKTTLINLLLGKLESQFGAFYRAGCKWVYIDQDYSILDNQLQVYQQAQGFNTTGLLEHEVKTRLSRFLFTQAEWDKDISALGGGERMRLMICCLSISQEAPDLIILDEPTNNLDIQNLEILTAAINDYEGTLLVVSHDESFLKQVGVMQSLVLD